MNSDSYERSIQVCIVYPADPAGLVLGGIESFIRGILRWAPDDISMHLVGMTTDAAARPVGLWHMCETGRKPFKFFPVLEERRAQTRKNVPLIVRFIAALMAKRPRCHADILEFHRIEPLLAYLFGRSAKNAFFHQDMAVLRDKASDIRWSWAPWLYFALERMLIPRLASVYAVRESAAAAYRMRFPKMAHAINFIPTWMDPEVFSPPRESDKASLREALLRSRGISTLNCVLAFVGRLDSQKDPLLLLQTFHNLIQRRERLSLVVIGDGVLRNDVERYIHRHGLEGHVVLTGAQPQPTVASWLQAADVFVLPSAYEGMPMSVLEALGCGTPVVSTDVGEVRRVVHPGENGEIADSRTPAGLAAAIGLCLDRLPRYIASQCTRVVREYVPERILAPVYENYRRIAARKLKHAE